MAIKFANQTAADRYYLMQALLERASTDDPKAALVPQSAVGAIIATQEKIIARSANVVPPALRQHYSDEGRKVSDADRYYVIEHAERAAIFLALRSHADMTGATLYCTRFPCSDCARAIVWSGIKRVVFPGGFAGEQQWLVSQRAALQILRSSQITVRYLVAETLVR
jgi:dCMP deaminase